MKKNPHLFVGLFILIAFGCGFLKSTQYCPATGFHVDIRPANVAQKPRFESDFASSKLYTETHAASLVELNDGRVRAFWFSGSCEGARDVQIHSAVFDPRKDTWSAEQVVATREGTEKSVLRYISKLGNPVCGRAADGTLWLYYVTVSLGGWSGSSISVKTSKDEGQTWSAAQRIVTSPFLDVSTLVKGTPFSYSDGTMGLPVYRELNNKFGEILHFNKAGNLIDIMRLSAGKDDGLQPVILVKNRTDAQILMRNSGHTHSRRVISISTQDGGRSWSKPIHLTLFNPDSALSAVVLPDKRILAVLNNQDPMSGKGRLALALMISADGGKTWKMIDDLEDQSAVRKNPLNPKAYFNVVKKLANETANNIDVDAHAKSAQSAMCKGDACGFEFSYPYLIQTKNGDFQLVYTWNRAFIKHVWFNQAWLDQRLKK